MTDDGEVIDGELEVPVLVPDSEKESAMSLDPVVAGLMTHQLQQTGLIAQNNFVTVQKVVDYDYLENKRIVTLDEAVGVREVQAQVTPGGPAPRA